MNAMWEPRVLSRLYSTGLVEEYQVRIADPHSNRAVLLRYAFTRFYPVDGATGECWAVIFDGVGDGGVTGGRSTYSLDSCNVTADMSEIRIGDSLLAPGMLVGSVPDRGISWRVSFPPTAENLLQMPQAGYWDSVPVMKRVAPYPLSEASGVVEFPGGSWDVAGWHLSLSHNWGRHHPRVLAAGLLAAETHLGRLHFQGFSASTGVGGRFTSGTLSIGNRKMAFTSPGRILANRGKSNDEGWSFRLVNGSHTLDGQVRWPGPLVASLRMVQPDGRVVWARSTMLATGQLSLKPRFPGSDDLAFHTLLTGSGALTTIEAEQPEGPITA